ncbi:MAG: PKD domain-containing protein [Methanoregula sp.]
MQHKKNCTNRESGVSEVIGAVLLIALVVVAVAIVGVGLLSQPLPKQIPVLEAIISSFGDTIQIFHNGGDPLQKEDLMILVDDQDKTENFFKGADLWSLGDLLTYTSPDSRNPENVKIVYTGAGASAILSSANFGKIGIVPTITPAPPAPVAAGFTGTPTSGVKPLGVQFTDASTGPVTLWSWTFGDGNTSTVQSPQHTYPNAGTYSVSLTVSNGTGTNTLTRTNFIQVTKKSFVDFVINENVFVYGSQLSFAGDYVSGPGSTVVITGPLTTSDLNGGTSIDVTTIYIDGDVNLNGGSAGLGSLSKPGAIYVNGDMTLGNGARNIYGDVYVTGNFKLKDARIHGNVYVDGDLALDWTPTLDSNARIYYKGTFTHPPTMGTDILSRCIHQAPVPGFTMPDLEIPPVKSSGWYTARGYVSGGALTSNMKIVADSYSSSSFRPTANNVIIVARNGDITLTGLGSSGVTGVLFAPNGKVTFNGGFFEGLVIARNGFEVTSGGTQVTFRNLDVYISNPDDYPF